MITPQEIINITFNRNIDHKILKPSMIDISEYNYINRYIGDDLYFEINNNQNNYVDFIEKYIKPIISWGVLYDNFEYISLNITDKGVYQLVVEGGATLIGRDSRYDSKMEFKRNLYSLINMMIKYIEYEKNNNNSLFTLYNSEYKPAIIKFIGVEKNNNITY